MYKVTLYAHVDISSEAQKSEFVVNAIDLESAKKRAEVAQWKIAKALGWVDCRVERVQEMVCTCPTEEERNTVHPRPSFSFCSPTRIRYCVVHGAVPFTVRYGSGDPLTMELHRRVAESMESGE